MHLRQAQPSPNPGPIGPDALAHPPRPASPLGTPIDPAATPLTLTPQCPLPVHRHSLAQMPISNLVECAVNLAEKVTGRDIDGDGDVGVAVRRPLAAPHPPPSAALWPECCAVPQPSLSWFTGQRVRQGAARRCQGEEEPRHGAAHLRQDYAQGVGPQHRHDDPRIRQETRG